MVRLPRQLGDFAAPSRDCHRSAGDWSNTENEIMKAPWRPLSYLAYHWNAYCRLDLRSRSFLGVFMPSQRH